MAKLGDLISSKELEVSSANFLTYFVMNECHECFPKIWLNNNFLDQSIVSFVHINSRCIVYFFILLNEVFLIQKSTFSVCSEVYICCKYRREKFRICYCVNKSSAIRQKGESRNGCYKKTKHAKFSEKRTFLTPDTHTCA